MQFAVASITIANNMFILDYDRCSDAAMQLIKSCVSWVENDPFLG